VLARYKHLEAIPGNARDWGVNANNAGALALTLAREREQAFLFRDLATLRAELPLFTAIDALEWPGPTPAFPTFAARFDAAVESQGDPRKRSRG
jgi:hypothetical protein